jgi:hypothetical protein
VRRGSSPIKRPSSPLKNTARDDKESSSKAAKNIPTGQDSLEMDIDSDEEPIVTVSSVWSRVLPVFAASSRELSLTLLRADARSVKLYTLSPIPTAPSPRERHCDRRLARRSVGHDLLRELRAYRS